MALLSSKIKREEIKDSSFGSLRASCWCGLETVDWDSTCAFWNAVNNSKWVQEEKWNVIVY